MTPPALARRALRGRRVASGPDFATDQSPLRAAGMLETDLVLHVRQTDAGGLEARAVSGTTGQPDGRRERRALAVRLADGAPRRSRTARTSGDGLATFEPEADRVGGRTSSSRGAATTVALDPTLSVASRPRRRAERDLVGARLHGPQHLPAAAEGALEGGRLPRPGRAGALRASRRQTTVTVTLVDANGQAVESKTVTTNAYGSAAGEFAIPAGRALGGWNVRCDAGRRGPIRVEEYKRPTFEVTLDEAEGGAAPEPPGDVPGRGALLLRPAGHERQRRAGASRASRTTRGGGGGAGRARAAAGAETVATGKAALDGRRASRSRSRRRPTSGPAGTLTYRYRVSADVTDEGGETRSAERSFRLGFVSVKATTGEREEFFLRR